MFRVSGKLEAKSVLEAKISSALKAPQRLELKGYLQSLRKLGRLAFGVLKHPGGFLQLSFEQKEQITVLREGLWLEVSGECVAEARAPGGVELRVKALRIISEPALSFPVSLEKKALGLTLESDLEIRPLSLRHATHFQRFRLQAAIAEGFRKTLQGAGFQEIFTPKIVAGSAEGGAGVFKLNYFGKEACLAQSPQLYKQMLVGVYGRVFEVGHVYRAEEHNTSRHLDEYVSLDLEVGFVEELSELIEIQAALISGIMEQVRENCAEAIAELGISLPACSEIPVLHVAEAKAWIREGHPELVQEEASLCAAEERALGELVLAKYGAELVFVTHYHKSARPFYTRGLSPEAPETLSYDLIFRGMEITTGGLRIHKPEELKAKMLGLGMSLKGFEAYLSAFEYGLPPHGGSGTGLERLTALLCGEHNIRQGVLFPRDMHRVTP